MTYTADDDGYHATVEYHGDITHHPHHDHQLPTPDYRAKHLPPSDYHDHHRPLPKYHDHPHQVESLVNEIPTEKVYKYNPSPGPTLLPKLFVPRDQPTFKKPPPALKLDKAPPPPEPTPVVGHHLRKYSYSPIPYPSVEVRHEVQKPHVYKGKIVFIDKP